MGYRLSHAPAAVIFVVVPSAALSHPFAVNTDIVRIPLRPLRWALAAFLFASWAAPAAAYNNDIALRSLGRPENGTLSDPATLRYRALTSELILALVPSAADAGETLGLSGFSYSLGVRGTSIHASHDFWQGQPNTPVLEGPMHGQGVPDMLWAPTLRLRKGLPLSSEISMAGTYLPHSHMLMLSGSFKLSFHEQSIRWLPTLTARLSGHRMVGAQDFDITGGDLMGIVSYPIAIKGAVTLTPFVSYSQIYAEVSSALLDETPFSVSNPIDQTGGTDGSLYQFPTLEWRSNSLPRWSVGLRTQYAIVNVLYEFSSGNYKTSPGWVSGHTLMLSIDT